MADPRILDLVWNNTPSEWTPMSHHSTLVELFPVTSREKQEVTAHMMTASSLLVTDIQRIQNPVLWSKYLINKGRLKHTVGSVTVKKLFHGTSADTANEIVRHNFDYRKCVKGDFGLGVSFSPSAWYAHFYPKESMHGRCRKKVLILAEVAIGKSVPGNCQMKLPPVLMSTKLPADTSHKPLTEQVYVKYYDDEAYPKYLIEYSCMRGGCHCST